MSSPVAVVVSIVDSGATITNGTPAWRAASASEKVPTLLAVSPLAATRSAPATTTSAKPRARSEAAAESTINRCGAPIRASSQVVSRPPCSSGRVSSGMASSSRPRSCSVWMTASAVPRSTAASPPVLQIVITRSGRSPHSSNSRSAPMSPMAVDAASSSERTRWAASSAAAAEVDSAATRRTIRPRLTAVGRTVARRSTSAANSPGAVTGSFAIAASATP